LLEVADMMSVVVHFAPRWPLGKKRCGNSGVKLSLLDQSRLAADGLCPNPSEKKTVL